MTSFRKFTRFSFCKHKNYFCFHIYSRICQCRRNFLQKTFGDICPPLIDVRVQSGRQRSYFYHKTLILDNIFKDDATS
jgi:hypothetical protein